jgi:hypothetical protein
VAYADTSMPAAPYQSPMRAQCEAELAKDPAWSAEIKAPLRAQVHDEEATAMMKNKEHVVMAYAALWILTVAFVAFMWLRQQRLIGEMARLEDDLRRAVADENQGGS